MISGKKLLIAIVLMPASLVLLRVNGWFGMGFPIGLLFSILYSFDYLAELQLIERPNRLQKIFRWILFVPQAIFGITCAVIGISMMLWVLYNTFIERLPEYKGGLLTFGIGPSLFAIGAGWLVSAFRGRDSGNPPH